MDKKIAHLRKDPVLRAVIDAAPLEIRKARRNHFKSLVVSIINQQLSGKAADTIQKRFEALFKPKKFPTPEDVLKTPFPKMRKVGLSNAKVSFIKDLARKVHDGTINFRKMNSWTDEEVIAHLVQVKGIGRWTAEMFLMFSLERDDIFSYGDLALRKAMEKLYKLKKNPTPAQAEKISAAWSPYRTLASRYLWATMDFARAEKSAKKAKW